MSENQTLDYADLISKSSELRRATDRVRAQETIETEISEAMAKYNLAGVDLEPPDVRNKVRATFSERWDESVASQLIEFDGHVKAREAALAQRLEDSRRPPRPKDPVSRDLRLLVAFREFEGASMTDLIHAYTNGSDQDDPALTQFIEGNTPADLVRKLKLRADDGDSATSVEVTEKLLAAIKARRTARQDAVAASELDALRSWFDGPTNGSLRTFIRDARDGKLEIARARRRR